MEGRVGQLKRVGDREKPSLAHDRADELQTNGQALRRSAAGDGNSGKTAEIRGAVVAEQNGACWVTGAATEADTVAVQADCLFADERCRNGSRGQGQGIQMVIPHHGQQGAKEGFASLQGLEVGGGRDVGAKFQTFPNILTIIGRARGKPAGLLVVMGGLSPGDLIAGIFGFAKKRD